MFSYNISKTANHAVFRKTCNDIEAAFSDIKKETLLEDVDGSQIQIYVSAVGEIKVYNDYEVDAVYADSDFSLADIIKQ